MAPRSPVSVTPVSISPTATLPNGGSNGSHLSVIASSTLGRPNLPTPPTMPSIYTTGSPGPPLPRMHPKRKPLPSTVDVNTLSTLTSGRFPGGGPPSPIRHTQNFSASNVTSPGPIPGHSAQGQSQIQSTSQYVNNASPSPAQAPYTSQHGPQTTVTHRYVDTIPRTTSTENVIQSQILHRQSQENRDGKLVTHSGAAMRVSSPSLRPPPGVLAATNTESRSTKSISRSSTASTGSSRSLSIQESPIQPLQIRGAAFQTHPHQRASTASTVSSNSVSSVVSVSAKSGTSSASLKFSKGSAMTDLCSSTQRPLSHHSQFSERTISSTASQLPNSSTISMPAVAPAPNNPLVVSKRADYVKYLRRQRATVWSDRMQRDLLNKQRQGHHHKEKERGKKPREDEYSTYTHAYAYYHPKLDMTLELSDARAVGDTTSTKLASQSSGISLDDEIETRTEKPEDKDVEDTSVTDYLVTEAPTVNVPARELNFGKSATGKDDSPPVADSGRWVTSSQETAAPQASLQTSMSSDASATSYTRNSFESSTTAISPEDELARRLSVGSLDEQAIAPRRTLYIVNPDYSGSDED
ncbi:uncharacterized protein V1513DRAFT_113292 [Lipomyces chichibuensis]|uniref:uncharacterized protein n=1 Tax=Lipomyces chichibuensis TaxID=1546026 RepID=UPI0033437040